MKKNPLNNPLGTVQAILLLLTFFLPKKEGRLRRWRNRRYKFIVKLREEKDSKEITPEQYAERLKDWDENHPEPS